MSKRSDFPQQKGSALITPVMKQPTKLVIRAVNPNSPLAAAVIARFSGVLKQFHGQHIRNYSLSENAVYKARRRVPGATMTYTNIGGNDQLLLEVDTPVLKLLDEVTSTVWDYALIELVVPDMKYPLGTSQLTCFAHLTMPVEQVLLPTDVWPVKGVAGNTLVRTTPDPMLNAAESDDFVRIELDPTLKSVASFTVDLRPARGLSAVTVDLHPFIGVNESLPFAAINRTDDNALTGPQPPANYIITAGLNPAYQLAYTILSSGLYLFYKDFTGPISFTTDEGGGAFGYHHFVPEITFDRGDALWKFENGTQFIDMFMGQSYGTAPGPGGTTIQTVSEASFYRHWTVVQSGDAAYYTGPDSIPGEVQVTLFKGKPPMDVTRYDSAYQDYHRWTFPLRYPDRPGHSKVAEVDVPARNIGLTTVNEIYGVPKLGTVLINQLQWGVSWQSA